MLLKAAVVVGLGLVAFSATAVLLRGPRGQRPEIAGRPGNVVVDNERAAPPPVDSRGFRTADFSRPEPEGQPPGPALTLPPMSDYDTLALESPAAASARAAIRTRIVAALYEGRGCLGADHWGDSRVLLVLRVAPSAQALVVQSVEQISVFSGSDLGRQVLDCLQSSVRLPLPIPIPATTTPAGATESAAPLPAGSVHVLVNLPGRKDGSRAAR